MTIWLKIVKLGLALACFAVLLAPFAVSGQQSGKQSGSKSAPAEPTTVAPPPVKKTVDYNRFTHETHLGEVKVPNTNFARKLNCQSCHERPTAQDSSKSIVANTDRNKQLILKFPGHKACVECHIREFTPNPKEKPPQTCVICHNTQQGLTAQPPQREFPDRYDFTAFFDAKKHEEHITYKLSDGKQLGCAFCHKPTQTGLAETIGSHPECYICHSPGSFDQKAKVKSDCAVCHGQGIIAPKPEPFAAKLLSRAYGAKFSHFEHGKYMDCKVCHTVQGLYNQNSPSSPRVKEHNTAAQAGGRGCFTCHDGKSHYGRNNVFSGDDAKACVKCHNTATEIKVPRIRG